MKKTNNAISYFFEDNQARFAKETARGYGISTGYAQKLDIRVTPHTLRHTFAAHLAEKGMPLPCIQDLLGHDNIKNTRIYAQLCEHARKKQYDRYQ